MGEQLTFREVVRMLRDRAGWRLTERRKFLDDEATYRKTGIYTYLDCSGVRFRKYAESGDTENPVVYDTGLLAYLIICPLTNRLHHYLRSTRE